MKKSIQQIISLSLCAVMCAGMAGCGTKEASNDAATVVTVWTGNGHDKAFLNEKIDQWNKTTGKDQNIRIEYTVQEGKISDKLALAFETDQAPDLFTGANVAEYAEKGYIAPYDDLEGTQQIIDQYEEYTMYGRHKYKDGKIYSLPKSTTTYGLIYNKDMFKAAGIVDENGEAKPPETLEELREYAKRLTNPDKKEYGIIFPGKFVSWYSDDIMKMSSASSGFVDGYNPKTGEFDYSYEAQVMKTILGIKADGSCYPGVEGLDNDPARARFAAGGVAMKTAGSYDYGVFTDQFPATVDWDVAPFPVIDTSDKHKQHMGNSAYLFINKKSAEEKGEKLAKVLEFFYSDALVIEAYKAGIDIPIKWDLVKDIEIDQKMSAWRNFAGLVSISQASPSAVATDMQGQRGMNILWTEEIWPGNVPAENIDAYTAEFSQKKNDAAKRYQEINPEYDPSPYIIPDWNSAREN